MHQGVSCKQVLPRRHLATTGLPGGRSDANREARDPGLPQFFYQQSLVVPDFTPTLS